MELALASGIPVGAWRDESDAVIATAVTILAAQAAALNRKG